MIVWNKEEASRHHDTHRVISKNALDNSDMMEVYDDKPLRMDGPEKVMDWAEEFNKVKFTTPYLVYKLRPFWIVLDQFS